MQNKFRLLTITALMFLGLVSQAQDNTSTPDSSGAPKKEKERKIFKPARSTFASGTLLDQQTTQNLKPKTLEFMIQHRFGDFQNGYQDIWGLYGNANIRIGFDYGIIDILPYMLSIQVGYGVTKDNLTSDFRAKVALIKQSRDGRFPVSISYFGDIGIAGIQDTVQFPKAVDRLSYFHEIIVSRRFNDYFSLQVAGSYSHYNIVAQQAGTPHDNYGISGGAKIKVSTQCSVLLEFDYPFANTGRLTETYNADKTYPNLGIGWEISTGSHDFQFILADVNEILPQADQAYNAGDLAQPKKGLMLGFNINRLLNFTGKKNK